MKKATDNFSDRSVQSARPRTPKKSGCLAKGAEISAKEKDKLFSAPSIGKKKDLKIRLPLGGALLRDPAFNKGTAFTEAERDALGIQGLLPPCVTPIELQLVRTLGNIRRKSTNLDKYLYLTSLQDRNMTLFYRILMEHIEELMPIVYTPTV